MIRSLRWRLQLWHAAVLTTVLIIFGGVVYALQWQTRLQQADAELDDVADVLKSRLRGLFPVPRMNGPGSRPQRPPGRGIPQRPAEDQPADAANPTTLTATSKAADIPPSDRAEGPTRLSDREGLPTHSDDEKSPESPAAATDAVSANSVLPPVTGTLAEPSRDGTATRDGVRSDSSEPRRREGRGNQRGNPRDGFRDIVRDGTRDGREGPREQPWTFPGFAPPPGLGLPDEFKHLFEGDDENSFYYVIWDQHGTVLAKSRSNDDTPFPNLRTSGDHLPVREVRTRNMRREVVHVSRFDINVLVGRSLQPKLAALHRSGLLLGSTGLAVLVIGLAGGWWFSFRAIRPIAEMTATAESISVKNLSKRINVQSTAAELEQLAVVLNHTFDRLQSSFERQGQFTADASHELRTPLAVILSHAELALARPRSPDEYQAAFNTCRRAALRMKSLIDSLLLLARFDSVEAELDLRQVDLDRMAQESVEMLQAFALERQVTLSCQTVPVSISADWERLTQVLTNLVSNAIRYNRPEGSVEVQVTSSNQTAILRVTDTGVGIAPEHLPRIFDRFYRIDKARSQAEGGCGLGLAICQTIVEAHHGTITATSEPGVGTTIEVRLPISNPVEPVKGASAFASQAIQEPVEVAAVVR